MTDREFIKKKRLAKGWSYRRLGLVARVSHSFIQDCEKGKSEISHEKLVRIVHALDISMFEFLAAINYTKPVKNPSASLGD